MFGHYDRWLVSRLIVLLVIPASIVFAASGRCAEPPTLDAIRTSLEKQREQVKSLYIEVKGYSTTSVDLKVLGSWPKFSRNFAPPFEERTIFAFKGGKRYARQMGPSEAKRIQPDGPPKVDPKASASDQVIQKSYVDDYKRREQEKAKWARMGIKTEEKDDPNVARLCPDDARADDGRVTWERRTIHGNQYEVFINRHDPVSQWVHADGYLMSIGWDGDTVANTQDEWALAVASNNLVNALKNGAFTLAREVVDLDGTKCVLLEREVRPNPQIKFMAAGRSRVWLDLDHGFAVRQVEFQQPSGDLSRTINCDFVEILPGIWFPRKTERQSFAPEDAPKEYQGRPVWIWHADLMKWHVNDVADELFDVVIKPGDRVNDLRLNVHP